MTIPRKRRLEPVPHEPSHKRVWRSLWRRCSCGLPVPCVDRLVPAPRLPYPPNQPSPAPTRTVRTPDQPGRFAEADGSGHGRSGHGRQEPVKGRQRPARTAPGRAGPTAETTTGASRSASRSAGGPVDAYGWLERTVATSAPHCPVRPSNHAYPVGGSIRSSAAWPTGDAGGGGSSIRGRTLPPPAIRPPVPTADSDPRPPSKPVDVHPNAAWLEGFAGVPPAGAIGSPSERGPGNRYPDQRASGKQDPAERDPGEQDPAERDPGKQDPAERDPGEQDPAERDPSEQDPAERDPGAQYPGEQYLAERDPGEQYPAEREPGKQDPAERDPGEQGPSERGTAETCDRRPAWRANAEHPSSPARRANPEHPSTQAWRIGAGSKRNPEDAGNNGPGSVAWPASEGLPPSPMDAYPGRTTLGAWPTSDAVTQGGAGCAGRTAALDATRSTDRTAASGGARPAAETVTQGETWWSGSGTVRSEEAPWPASETAAQSPPSPASGALAGGAAWPADKAIPDDEPPHPDRVPAETAARPARTIAIGRSRPADGKASWKDYERYAHESVAVGGAWPAADLPARNPARPASRTLARTDTWPSAEPWPLAEAVPEGAPWRGGADDSAGDACDAGPGRLSDDGQHAPTPAWAAPTVLLWQVGRAGDLTPAQAYRAGRGRSW